MFLASLRNSRFKVLPDFNRARNLGNAITHWAEDSAMHIHSPTAASNINELFSCQSEDIHQTERLFYSLQLLETITCFLAALGFGCAAISYDLTSSETLTASEYTCLKIISILTTISTFILLISIYSRTHAELKWQQSKGVYNSMDNLITSGKLLGFIFELIINLLHPFWGMHSCEFRYMNMKYQETGRYRYNDILTVIMLLRAYHIVRVVAIFSYYRSMRAQRICQINGRHAGTAFSIKSQMMNNPMLLLVMSLVLPLLMAAFSIRILENPTDSLNGFQFREFGNCLWCIVVTFTTVGYGDYVPETIGGRTVAFMISLWGIAYLSLMTNAVTNIFILEPGEQKSLMIMKKLKFKEGMRSLAAWLVTSGVRYRYMKRHDLGSNREKYNQLLKFRHYSNLFRNLRLKQRNLYDFESFGDRLEQKMKMQIENSTAHNEVFTKIEYYLTCLEKKVELKHTLSY